MSHSAAFEPEETLGRWHSPNGRYGIFAAVAPITPP
jgi:hypothetical protein